MYKWLLIQKVFQVKKNHPFYGQPVLLLLLLFKKFKFWDIKRQGKDTVLCRGQDNPFLLPFEGVGFKKYLKVKEVQ